jgi:hypothetical protein
MKPMASTLDALRRVLQDRTRPFTAVAQMRELDRQH